MQTTEVEFLQSRMTRAIAKHFNEEIRFFKSWVEKPKAIGAVLPTSSVTARRMASIINPDSKDPILELGPGTGVISKAILERGVRPENLYPNTHYPLPGCEFYSRGCF